MKRERKGQKKNSYFSTWPDEERIGELISMTAHTIGISVAQLKKDLAGLSGLPSEIRLDLVSEVFMSYT